MSSIDQSARRHLRQQRRDSLRGNRNPNETRIPMAIGIEINCQEWTNTGSYISLKQIDEVESDLAPNRRTAVARLYARAALNQTFEIARDLIEHLSAASGSRRTRWFHRHRLPRTLPSLPRGADQ